MRLTVAVKRHTLALARGTKSEVSGGERNDSIILIYLPPAVEAKSMPINQEVVRYSSAQPDGIQTKVGRLSTGCCQD